ncbi:MAG: hypothetical protein E6G97_17785 [Alphaproteobacteria bacterium]|nr:MAG: hypothetical protein E6G97_17785 [Alphaproteobacteria bacterium]
MSQKDKSALALVRALFVEEDQSARQLLADLFEEEGDEVAATSSLRAEPYIWRLRWGPNPDYDDQDNTQIEYHASKALALREGARAAHEMALDHFELDLDDLDELDPDVAVFKNLAALLEEGRHQEAIDLFDNDPDLGDRYVLSVGMRLVNCE